jgi:hypothetical protein
MVEGNDDIVNLELPRLDREGQTSVPGHVGIALKNKQEGEIIRVGQVTLTVHLALLNELAQDNDGPAIFGLIDDPVIGNRGFLEYLLVGKILGVDFEKIVYAFIRLGPEDLRQEVRKIEPVRIPIKEGGGGQFRVVTVKIDGGIETEQGRTMKRAALVNGRDILILVEKGVPNRALSHVQYHGHEKEIEPNFGSITAVGEPSCRVDQFALGANRNGLNSINRVHNLRHDRLGDGRLGEELAGGGGSAHIAGLGASLTIAGRRQDAAACGGRPTRTNGT